MIARDVCYIPIRAVIQSFGNVATEDIFHGTNSKAARTIPRNVWSVVRRKLDMVSAATSVQALRVPPGNRLEALHGDRAGSFSIRVNDQYRITFRFDGEHAYDVCCEDSIEVDDVAQAPRPDASRRDVAQGVS